MIRMHHYAKGCSKAGKMFGAFRDGRLIGVAQWLPPTKVAAQSVLPDDWQRVTSLTRLVVLPGEPQNAATMLIAASLKRLRTLRREDGSRKWLACLTYADLSEGHTGAIYRASNWVYCGTTGAKPRWKDAAGRQVSPKAGPKTRTAAEMRALGYEVVGHFKKHKFTYALK